jgi:deoxyuridine 5''-triphosphate nucleotidohydrolase (dut)
MKLKVKKLVREAILPDFAHYNDAGMDLYCVEKILIKSGEKVQIRTGIAMEIPDGYVGLIWDKSGLSHKFGLKTFGGVFDAGYRGEILLGMVNLGQEDYVLEVGNKVAQMLIQKVEQPEIVEVKELSEGLRGERRFGSTGK